MGLSFWHFLIVLIIVLLIFGPSRLSGLGKSLGESIRGFKKGLQDDEVDVTTTARQEQLAENDPEYAEYLKQKAKDKNKTET